MRVWNGILDKSEEYGSSPVTEPVTVAEFKNYALLEGFQDVEDSTPVDFDGDDDLIEMLIAGARESVEKFTGLSLVSKTLTVMLTNLAGGVLLPGAPIGDITSLTDEDGDEITDYTVLGND